jgi:hypothetical protein
MKARIFVASACLAGLVASGNASAWFIFLPIGAMARALETDPDSITVSSEDRALGKCAGLHVNQGRKYVDYHPVDGTADPFSSSPSQTQSPASPIGIFHKKMIEEAIGRASERDKVEKLAHAYSTKWGRAAGVDRQANLAYGADLARGCVQSGIAVRYADYPAWQAQQEARRQTRAEEQQKRVQTQEQQKSVDAEVTGKRAGTGEPAAPAQPANMAQASTAPRAIDFSAEARKSARILGCNAAEARVIGVDGQSILFTADCEGGPSLTLACDQSGLCLKRSE